MVTEDYVSFENAKLLKEKGFNEPCRLYYDKYHGYVPIFVEDSKLTEYGYKEIVRNDQNSISDFIASAPSLYVTMKWLWEKHNILVVPMPFTKKESNGIFYNTAIYKQNDGTKPLELEHFIIGSTSNEQACEEGILYCLKNMI